MEHKIYEYIKTEETNYQTLPTPIVDGWDWNMFKHIKKSVIYKFGQYLSGKSDDKPNKNIILPLLRLRYRTEGFDVKDVELFIDDRDKYFKSFLIKKFHEKWARENKIDTFIDEGVETDIDVGGVLIKNINEVRPEVVPWQRIAFCDATDIISAPICERHQFSPDELLEMVKSGWDKDKIDEIITLAENSKSEKQVDGR